jgi:hypothetical protein
MMLFTHNDGVAQELGEPAEAEDSDCGVEDCDDEGDLDDCAGVLLHALHLVVTLGLVVVGDCLQQEKYMTGEDAINTWDESIPRSRYQTKPVCCKLQACVQL